MDGRKIAVARIESNFRRRLRMWMRILGCTYMWMHTYAHARTHTLTHTQHLFVESAEDHGTHTRTYCMSVRLRSLYFL